MKLAARSRGFMKVLCTVERITTTIVHDPRLQPDRNFGQATDWVGTVVVVVVNFGKNERRQINGDRYVALCLKHNLIGKVQLGSEVSVRILRRAKEPEIEASRVEMPR